MFEYILPPILTLVVYVLTLAWGESFFRLFLLADKRLKNFLLIPMGMLVWPLLALIFSHIFKMSAGSFSILLTTLSFLLLAINYRAVWNSIATNKGLLIFVVFMGSLLFLFKVPGNNHLMLGDAPEYLQIAKNILNGLGYKVNFMIADHYGSGLDSIIRPASNRFPLMPFRLAALGSLVGFQNYLVNIVIIIMAGSVLNLFAGLCKHAYKKLLFWAVPFFFSMQGLYIWGGAFEFEVMLYLCSLLYLLYILRESLDPKHIFLIALMEVGLLYGGNGTGFFVFIVTVFALFFYIFIQRAFSLGESTLVRMRTLVFFFLLLPPVLFSPWLIYNAKTATGGNGLYNFASYEEEVGLRYGEKALPVVVEDVWKQTKCKPCLSEMINMASRGQVWGITIVMSNQLMSENPPEYSTLLDNKNLKEYLLNVVLKPPYLKQLMNFTIFNTAKYYRNYWYFYYALIPVALAFIILKGRRRETLALLVISSFSIAIYSAVLHVYNIPLDRMYIPFLLFHWFGLAFLIERGGDLVKLNSIFKYLIVFACFFFSIHLFYKQVQVNSDDTADILEIAEWIKENTDEGSLIYGDPPQLITFLTGRRTIGSSWSEAFIEMADRKYKPDYFVINNYRKTRRRGYFNSYRYIMNNYEVLVKNDSKHYLIFTKKR